MFSFLRLLTLALGLLLFLQTVSAQSVQIYASISGLNGPVASVPGLAGSNFFALGCSEHQMERSGISQANHSPILITKALDPITSPLLRQSISSGAAYTSIDIFYMTGSGGSMVHTFTVRLSNVRITKITTAVDGSGLMETLSLEYGQIYWLDPISGSGRGWDAISNLPIP